MGIFQLPVELLFHILNYLGAQFFRQDTRRLTVSKSWYGLAWKVLLRDLQFTARSLRQFTHDHALLTQSQPYITTVKIYLEATPRSPAQSRTDQITNPSPSDEWSQTATSLTRLSTTLHRGPALRSLTLRARALDLPQHREYLTATSLCTLLCFPPASVFHLTTLDIDTATSHIHQSSSPLEDDDGSNDGDTHLCHAINTLLVSSPSLRRLRCRMESVCPALLAPPASAGAPLHHHLEEVIVNLSLAENSETVVSWRHARGCRRRRRRQQHHHHHRSGGAEGDENEKRLGIAQLRKAMSEAATVFVEKVFAFDAVEGRRVELPFYDGRDWAAEGEVWEEEDVAELEDEVEEFEEI
ncbi:hypothetical protein NEMBOFW57_010067 [Staphylotrichum longicolle]|uniref:F-box domain-containing protein n=1 Tax=Staphylotrichum longicolle TaxID=669026 RepID=A0AAD4EQM0_9PEZI|nr:hypothetical protein NEMBOFW57_010067 [Staphylotrichum longicolle]